MNTRPSFDDFLAVRRTDPRLARLTHDVALPRSYGLEFGPGDSPLPLPDGLSVRYLDLHPGGGGEGDSPIDHVWSGSGSLAAVLAEDMPRDFAIARLFAHKVPNLLGWFRGIFEVLRPGGVLNLTLPDKRVTEDVLRAPSTIGELLDADHLGLERPSFRQRFEHRHLTIPIGSGTLWQAGVDPAEQPRVSAGDAIAFARAATAAGPSAGDAACRCWVFTPLSFLDVLEELSRARQFPFVISQFAATEPGASEFFVCLRRDHVSEPVRLLHRQEVAINHVRAIALERRRRAQLLAGD